jgi:Transglutaminase-like superfamily
LRFGAPQPVEIHQDKWIAVFAQHILSTLESGVTEHSRDFLRGEGLKRRMEAWRGFWRLSASSRSVAFEAAALLVATWAGIRMIGFRRWKSVLASVIPRKGDREKALEPTPRYSAPDVAHLAQSAARHLFFQPNCLEQSLALWWLLQRRGIAAELRIGARKEDGRFEAHAWVEIGGVAVNETGAAHLHFVPFRRPIASTSPET